MLQDLPNLMKDVFLPTVLSQGQVLYARGDVLKLKISEGMVKGRVHEKSRGLFDVYFDLRTWPSVPARCTCSKSARCEHFAACLYDILFKQNLVDENQLAFMQTIKKRISEDSPKPFVISEWNNIIRSEGHDFFSYQLEVKIEDVRIDLVPFVAQWVASGAISDIERYTDDELIDVPITLQYTVQKIRVPFGSIKPLLHFFLQFGLKTPEQLHLNRYQLVALCQDLSGVHWQTDKAFIHDIRDILDIANQPSPHVPTSLCANLRDYQKVGLSWLSKLREGGFGGVLADDMGLGKTVQALAHLLCIKELQTVKHASLIVVPMSLVMNWYEECCRFAPDLSMLVYHGGGRHNMALHEYDVIVTTYGVVVRDLPLFLERHFDTLILDEAQAIKNPLTKMAHAVRAIKADHRLCLTGTPLENHLGELWSLFHFLMPGFLGDRRQFKHYFRNPIEKHADPARRELLAKRMKPFLLRRRKEDVVKELPQKTEILQKITFSQDQRYLYEAIRMTMEDRVRSAIARSGFQKSRIVLLDALLKLRQVCCDPRLLKMPHEAQPLVCSSAKLDFLLLLLDELVDEGRRVLVFSQFTSMLALIEDALVLRKISYLKLTGKTKNRQAVVNAFQAGVASVFLVSLKAGGVGLNLTKADVVIHFDPWWNPQAEDQATDRAHRIGQVQPVFVYKLVAAGTVEEAILMMQSKKRSLFEGVFDDNQGSIEKLNEQDLLELFKPLEGG